MKHLKAFPIDSGGFQGSGDFAQFCMLSPPTEDRPCRAHLPGLCNIHISILPRSFEPQNRNRFINGIVLENKCFSALLSFSVSPSLLLFFSYIRFFWGQKLLTLITCLASPLENWIGVNPVKKRLLPYMYEKEKKVEC